MGCVCVSLVQAFVFLILNGENKRYWEIHKKKDTPNPDFFARAAVIISCKGMEHQLRENLSAFLNQDHPNYEVIFVVESGKDPCVPLIRQLIRENGHVKTCLQFAGECRDCGQKVHNLRAATEKLGPQVEILAFADTDSRPQKNWLRWLVRDLGKTNLGARTGYRWMVPRKRNFATYLGCSINNSIAALMGHGKHLSVWGGSWAIHRRVFESVAIRNAWNNVLSDDMVATRALRHAGLDVKFEPQCICINEVKFSTRRLAEFLRRQFLIGRLHDRRYWWSAIAILGVSQFAFWGSLSIGIVRLLSSPDTTNFWLMGASGLYVIWVVRAVLRRKMGKVVFSQWRHRTGMHIFDAFASPVVGLFMFLAMLTSLIGTTITWRGIHYDLTQGGRVLLLGRDVDQNIWSITDKQHLEQTRLKLHRGPVPPSKAA